MIQNFKIRKRKTILPARQQKWDHRFMDAARLAASWSKDPETKVGSSLVAEDNILVNLGFNGFPRMVDETEDRLQKPLDNHYLEHSERNMYYNCVKLGIRTKGMTLYCTHSCCPACARGTIQSGVKRVVIDSACFTSVFYQKHQKNCELAVDMMREAGIRVDFLK